jgi:ABC-2 type transport system permease protein
MKLTAHRQSFGAMLKQQFQLLTRYPVNLIANFSLVLVMVIVVTLVVMMFVPAEAESTARGITLYGFVIFIFLSHTIWTVGLSVQREKTEGTLTSLYLTPASRFLSLLSRAVVTLAWTTVACVVGLLLAQAITGPLPLYNPGLALVILLFTISGLIGLGFAIAGFALHFGESIELVANILEFSLIGFCAFFFPFSVLPPALQTVSRLIPLSYSVDAFRTVALGLDQPELFSVEIEMIIVISTGILGPIVGYTIYHLNEKRARQQGKL